MNFRLLFTVLILIALFSLFYLWTRFHRFSFIMKVTEKRKAVSWLFAAIPILVIVYAAYLEPVSTVVVLLHLLVVWLIADLTGWIVRKISGRSWIRYWQGLAAIVFTLVYMSCGWYIAHNVVRTDYHVTSDKCTENLRVVMLADAHIGANFDGEGFRKHVEEIQKTNPDLVVIAGDFVDDDSKKEDVAVACDALGKLQTRYGVYYVYGNHDKGYFSYRNFNADELAMELKKNNVTILEDESIPIGDDVILIGRQDRSVSSRADMKTLIKGMNKDKYIIVADHQPNDYEAEKDSGVDLVLSGHTHGGWLFPMNIISSYTGPDDMVYGMKTAGNTTFLVTSGISDWALPFKTGTVSEYVVVDISAKNK